MNQLLQQVKHAVFPASAAADRMRAVTDQVDDLIRQLERKTSSPCDGGTSSRRDGDDRLVIWIRTDQGWQRFVSTLRPTDAFVVSDHDEQRLPMIVLELGTVPHPFDPATLSKDQVLVGAST